MRALGKVVCVALLATASSGCGPANAPSQGTAPQPADDKPDNPSLSVSLQNDNKLVFTHAGPQGTDDIDVPMGFAGHATSVEGPNYNVVVNLAWPSPKVCEMSMDYDSKGSSRTLTVSLTGFLDVKATRDGMATDLPVELPAGTHRLVITASCP